MLFILTRIGCGPIFNRTNNVICFICRDTLYWFLTSAYLLYIMC